MISNNQSVRWETTRSRWIRPALRVGTAYLVLIDLMLLSNSAGPALGVLFSALTILFVLLSEAAYRLPQARINSK